MINAVSNAKNDFLSSEKTKKLKQIFEKLL